MASEAGARRRVYQDSVDSRRRGVPPDQYDPSCKENAFDGWSLSDAMATQETCAKLLSDPRLSKTEAHDFLKTVWENVLCYAGLTQFADTSDVKPILEKLSGACEEALDYIMTKQIRLEDALSPAELALWQSTLPLNRRSRPLPREQMQAKRKYAIYQDAKERGEISESFNPAMASKLTAIVCDMKADFKKKFRAGHIQRQRESAQDLTRKNLVELAEKRKRNGKKNQDRSDGDSGSDSMRMKKKKPAARRLASPSSEEASDSPPERQKKSKKQRTARGSAASSSRRAK